MTNGIVFSQSGVPVEYAEDYQKVLDTRWKPVGIAMEYPINLTIEAPLSAIKVKLFDHNLGYVPAMKAPRQQDIVNRSIASAPFSAIMFCADSTSVYYIARNVGGTVSGTIYLYDFAINEPYDSAYRGIPMSGSHASDFGVKIVGNSERATNMINTGDEIGYAINTNLKTMSLAKVDVTTVTNAGGYLTDIVFDIPYPPLINFSRELTTDSFKVYAGGGVYNYPIAIDTPTYTSLGMIDNLGFVSNCVAGQATLYVAGLAGQTSADIAYIIMRDPAEIAS